jgi:hypothetical protein
MNGWETLLRVAGSIETPSGSDSWLLDCLRRNESAEYGLKYGFRGIHDADEYRAAVPMVTYEDISGFVSEMFEGRGGVLFSGRPVAYETTGGSGGGVKLIPYSARSLTDFRTNLLPWLASLIRTYRLGFGKAYMAISPAMRAGGSSPHGAPVGLPDGAYMGGDVQEAFLDISAVPPYVSGLASFGSWRIATLYHLLRSPDLELISVWSPTFMSGILAGITEIRGELSSLLRDGGAAGGMHLEGDRKALFRLDSYDGANAGVLWPKLKLVSCWTEGSSGQYAGDLAKSLPHANMEGKGLLLTEGVVTVPDGAGRALPAPSGFTEFLGERGDSLLAHELTPGCVYEVVMTTSGGLYRYRSGDSVRCVGFVGNAPILRFIGRCGVISDMVGEKLPDAFVSECMELARCRGILTPDRSLDRSAPGYLLLAEDYISAEAAAELEEMLRRNPQYDYALKLRQLRPLEAMRINNLTGRCVEFFVSRGMRRGDVKIPALCADPNFLKEVAGL